MQQRKDEILAKKAKLAELKRQRERRQKEFTRRDHAGEGSSELIAPTPAHADNRKDLDSLISSLVGDGRPTSLGSKDSRATSPTTHVNRPTSTIDTVQIGAEVSENGPQNLPIILPVQTISVGTQTIPVAPVPIDHESLSSQVKESITYSTGVQTMEPWGPPRRKNSIDGSSNSDPDQLPPKLHTPRSSKRLSRREREREDALRRNLRHEIEEELKAIKEPANIAMTEPTSTNFPARELTREETTAVISSEDFMDFVERSSKVIERALDQDYDVLADYALDGLNGPDDDDDQAKGYASSRTKNGRGMKEIAQFYDERWSRKRMISDINFSPKFPELVLASYTKNQSAPQDPSGILQIWNLHLHSRPEYIFHSTSDILTAKFSPFHPSLIFGGSYSGQVLLWDTRSRSASPVQKTPLTCSSSGGHSHPIYSIDIVGTQNANNIISCSTDGVVCGWTVDMLSQPQEYLELITPQPIKSEDLSPTCIAFPPADPTSFIVGTEEGTIYPCHRYDRAGAKAGVDAGMKYKGHSAPVMSLNFHPARGPLDLSDFVLTSSLDWTVKLWKVRAPASAAAAASTVTFSTTLHGGVASNVQVVTPLADFVREDVVYDARWSPQRPSVFALADGAGNVEVWDLTFDMEVPVTRATPSSNKAAGLAGTYSPRSLNKVAWEEKGGKRLAVGGAAGLVTVFEVGTELSGEGTKSEEWASTKRLMGKLERGVR